MSYIVTWLKYLIVAVMLMVVVGGATRLTHSGLSITQWKPLHVLPPITQKAWDDEFGLYQQTPEYIHVNKGMSLSEFKCIYWWEYALLTLIGLTIIYGAYVAGLKAGLIYNTFPLMEGQWIPHEWNFYLPVWTNFINNPATVQWLHRLLALATVAYSTILWIKHGVAYRLITIKIAAQVALGISTLLLQVPLAVALLHQAWAMVVWMIALKTVWVKK